jgi:epoxyqueuosine reductase
MSQLTKSEQIKSKANELGFLICTVAKAEYMSDEARRLEQWLQNGYQGEMEYMNNYFDKRVDPTLLVSGAKSVISLAYNYFTISGQTDIHAPKISKYAYGRDYHSVVKKKLLALFEWMKSTFGEINGRVFVDSAPILERDWARRSGLGWVGKNSLVIHPKKGSWFFLAEIISDLVLEYDDPMPDHCGTCTRCIDACPTEAISPSGYIVDGSRCISYLTIELKNNIPPSFKDKMENWMFGCDICQQVCPWNRFATEHQEAQFLPKATLMEMTREEWRDLSEPLFNTLFEGSAVKRTKFSGLKRNIRFLNE